MTTKAERIAEAERKAREAAEKDSLETVLDDAKETAVAIRGMRDTTTRELQRLIADDVLGSIIIIGEEFSERDFDHDVRLMRIELALGLEPMTAEEEAEVLDGSWEPTEEADDSDSQDVTDDSLSVPTGKVGSLGAQLDELPAPVLREAFLSLKRMSEIVAKCETPTEEEQKQAREVVDLLAFLLPVLEHGNEDDGDEDEDDETPDPADAPAIMDNEPTEE